MRFHFLILVFCLTLVLFTGNSTRAATFSVNTTNDTSDATPGNGVCADAASQCSLRAAIDEANALAGDDIITLPGGTYTQSLTAANEDLNAGGDWDINSNVLIIGSGEANTILQAATSAGTATERVMHIGSGIVSVSGLTVRFGRFTGTMSSSTRGAGIDNRGTLTLDHVVVRENQLSSLSGIPVGAGINNGGPGLTILNSTITANTNFRTSGGSAFGGGISSNVPTTLVITDSTITGNSSASQGGSGLGAGMHIENHFNAAISGSHFDGNTGSGSTGSSGTGIYALSNAGTAILNVTDTTFSNNVGATGPINQGVGVRLVTGTGTSDLQATFDRVTISGNVGNANGGGLDIRPTAGAVVLNLLNSTISGNTGANGGGVSVSNGSVAGPSPATISITNSTISGNNATANGGGLFVEQPTSGVIDVRLSFTTIAGNRANSDNSGAESGGGVFQAAPSSVSFKNSIVGDNSVGTGGTGNDLSGTLNSLDYNHIEDLVGATITGITTNNSSGDAQLGPLASNGGPNQTHLPAATSPVVNSIPNGVNDCGSVVTLDQRGVVRPVIGACDRGSVEVFVAGLPAHIIGRVTFGGNGVRNVLVSISGGTLQAPVRAYTSSFGYYRFDGLVTGETYTIILKSRRITFTPSSRQIFLTGSLENVDFLADGF